MHNLDVLDVGCGHGELVLDMAAAGAASVMGVDLDPDRIKFARRQLQASACSFPKRNVAYHCIDCRHLPSEQTFDIIVTRDTLEHVIELNEVIQNISRRLRPGGHLYAGAGPLYRSPYGGHGRMHMPIPWGHLIIPEQFLTSWQTFSELRMKR